jgi:hypothetical protein
MTSNADPAAGQRRAGQACLSWTGTGAAHGQLLDRRPAGLAAALSRAAGQTELIWYLSSGLHGGPVLVTGVVMTPRGDPPAGGWPVLAWGGGGYGVSAKSAPSRSAELHHKHDAYLRFLAGLLSAGYVIAATDYEGQISGGVRPFQAPYSEGRSMIDSVIAARQMHPGANSRWFAIGHSGGGHAALDAAEAADAGYAEALELLGVVAIEPAGDFTWVPQHISRLIAGIRAADPNGGGGRTTYVALVVGLKAHHPELRLADYLGPIALAHVDVTYQETSQEAHRVYAGLPATEFGPRTSAAAAQLSTWLEATAVPRQRITVPVFFPTSQDAANAPVVRLCQDRARELGDTTLTTLYPDVNHDQVLGACLDDLRQWLRARLEGLPAPSN